MSFTFDDVTFPLNGPPNGFGDGTGWTVAGDPPALISPTGEVAAVAELEQPTAGGVRDPFAGDGGGSYARLIRGSGARVVIIQASADQSGEILLITGPPSDDDPLGLDNVYVSIDAAGKAFFKTPPAVWNSDAAAWVNLPVPDPAA